MKRCLGALLILAALAPGGVIVSGANFAVQTSNPQTATAATDFVAPTVSSSVIATSTGGTPFDGPSFVEQGGSYRVYAKVTDAGNPASGVGIVTADLLARYFADKLIDVSFGFGIAIRVVLASLVCLIAFRAARFGHDVVAFEIGAGEKMRLRRRRREFVALDREAEDGDARVCGLGHGGTGPVVLGEVSLGCAMADGEHSRR